MDSLKVAIAANRFGPGARPAEPARIARPWTWLLDQLQGPAQLPAELRALPNLVRT